MLRRPALALLALVVLAGVGCSQGSSAAQEDTFGKCRARPGADCRNEDLRAVSLIAADLPKIDFSGSDLSNADFSQADLSGAQFVGATLAGTDFTGANLTGANFTDAKMFGVVLRGATLDGAVMTAPDNRCITTMPDGRVESGASCLAGTVTTLPQTSPPVIEYFRATEPVRCIEDVAGTSIDVEWSTRYITSVTFFVDGIRTISSPKRKGIAQVPFTCDGKPHPVLLQAVGPMPPLATASITATAPAP
jgi:hypothetical protein